MQYFTPDYYSSFQCIASACRHSCCIGWEIDIDADTREAYQRIEGELGKRLASYIADDEESSHFHLDEQERCPFLRRDGLCDLILELGEGALCQICRDHPRYRNIFAGREETGLGLCCEAAAELILSQQTPMRWILSGEDCDETPRFPEEEALLVLREKVMEALQNRTHSLAERIDRLLSARDRQVFLRSPCEWAHIYTQLEQLDAAWGELLTGLKRSSMDTWPKLDAAWEIPFEQLAVYFLCRHLPGALEDGRECERIMFSLLSTAMIAALFANAGTQSMAALVELARMYSSEIEYDEDNVEALLNAIADMRGEGCDEDSSC
ncbi:MAG: flagellin lysine-N-methylase [Clostridia bacterium]|nr:flagellin lysine-N-methylase [Clostridia bacterium]